MFQSLLKHYVKRNLLGIKLNLSFFNVSSIAGDLGSVKFIKLQTGEQFGKNYFQVASLV
jgi:hypothetical protein